MQKAQLTLRPAEKKGTTTKRRKKKTQKRPLWQRIPKGVWIGMALMALVFAVLCYKFIGIDSFSLRARFGEPIFPAGYVVRGIDVSHHQGEIEWERVRNARIGGEPVAFAFIKATEGTDMVDPLFHRNISRARRAELVVGAYHFFSPVSDPTQQAKLFIRNYALEEGDLPPVLDVEHANANITKEAFQRRVMTWLRVVEKEYGVKPIIYTGRNFKRDYLDAKEFDAYPLLLAHYYVKEMTYEGRWVLWQQTDRGEVPGIKGKVDCNLFNGDMNQFNKLIVKEDEK